MTMRATQKKMMSYPGNERRCRIEMAEVLRLLGPAQRLERPESRAEPRIEHILILMDAAAAAVHTGGKILT